MAPITHTPLHPPSHDHVLRPGRTRNTLHPPHTNPWVRRGVITHEFCTLKRSSPTACSLHTPRLQEAAHAPAYTLPHSARPCTRRSAPRARRHVPPVTAVAPRLANAALA
eukprot:733573-Rhodomonas_salina.1